MEYASVPMQYFKRSTTLLGKSFSEVLNGGYAAPSVKNKAVLCEELPMKKQPVKMLTGDTEESPATKPSYLEIRIGGESLDLYTIPYKIQAAMQPYADRMVEAGNELKNSVPTS
jgi:hypothetical protein